MAQNFNLGTLGQVLTVNTAANTVTYTSTINAVSHTVGTSFTANSTVTNTASLVVSTNTATIGTAAYHVANGNFGIGTSSPGSALSFGATGAAIAFQGAYGLITFANNSGTYTSGTTGAAIVTSGSSLYYDSYGGAHIWRNSSYAEYMRIAYNGYVGIGTSSPAYTLDVNGIVNATNPYGGFSALQTAGGIGYRWVLANDSSFRIQYTTNGFSSATTPIYISSNGNIGFGTTTPNASTGYNWLTINSTTNGGIVSLETAGTENFRIQADNPSNTTFINNISNWPMLFLTNNTERMRIAANGYVGIGTSSPNYSLDSRGVAYIGDGNVLTAGGSNNATLYIFGNNNIGTSGYYQFLAVKNTQSGVTNPNKFIRINSTGGMEWINSGYTAAIMTISDAGAFAATSKSFKIPHPLPELSKTKDLVHVSVESPQADLIYSGKVQLSNGTATVNIDTAANMTQGTFEVLCNKNIRVFTTNETDWTLTKGSVANNILTIIAQDQTSNATISWMVIGQRIDQYILATGVDANGNLIVEQDQVSFT